MDRVVIKIPVRQSSYEEAIDWLLGPSWDYDIYGDVRARLEELRDALRVAEPA